MKLLIDIGNTHTHVALATPKRLRKISQFPSNSIHSLVDFIGATPIDQVAICSVAPKMEKLVVRQLRGCTPVPHFLDYQNCGISINYPDPKSIGPDRLANARGGRDIYGTPLVVVDFGTAVTFDIVNQDGAYQGGVIAPGLSAMTDYLHEKTALLPPIKIKTPKRAIGSSTEEAMQIGAVQGYAGLIERIILGIKKELKVRQIKVIATGGCAQIMSRHSEGIGHVRPGLTLDGLRLASNDWS